MMCKQGTLFWTDRRGAGRVDHGDAAELAVRLKTLRRPARLEIDGEIIGECRRIYRGDSRYPRIKWLYWYDPDVVGKE